MEKIIVTEEIQKGWYEQAYEQTVDTLTEFCSHIMNDYDHDYGTVCHAMAACALAAVYAADKTENGGITGFQASFVMWGIIRQFNFKNNKCGMKITDYDDMLYPQNDNRFEKTISKDTWDLIQKEAKRLLENAKNVHPRVVLHWESIVNGVVPFGYTVSGD